jgi:hypothetical protein
VKNGGAIPSLATGINLPFYTWFRDYGVGVITLEVAPEASSMIDLIILGITFRQTAGLHISIDYKNASFNTHNYLNTASY